jgi:hypothetical protein
MRKSMTQETFGVKGHVLITNSKTNDVIFDKYNSVHPQNMARIIARALAKEPNYYIYRVALGNGGAQYVAGQIVINPPITGSDGSGWQSRLYNETYSEIVDADDPLVGTDPGDADANGVRPGGGADPADDPAPDNVVSQEVGTKSNVIVTMYLNENEPAGQTTSITDPTTGTAQQYFDFNELGLYSPGAQAINTPGYSTVNVGDQTSTSVSLLNTSTQYTISLTVNSNAYSAVLQTPSTGTGANGAITYGDICEGINSGSWIVSGDPINTYVYVFITDDSNGTYPSIVGKQSYGLLDFQSTTSGVGSNVTLSCTSGAVSDFFNNLVNGICGYVNYTNVAGANAGVANDPLNPTNERERLLTHLTFATLRKSMDESWTITYTLTVSVNPTVSTIVNETSSS